MKRKLMKYYKALLTISLLSLGACSIPGVTIFGNGDPGEPLASGESRAVHFFTTDPDYDTGIQLQAGRSYRLSPTLVSNWIDGPIMETAEGNPIDETGFEDSQMRWQWLSVFKRKHAYNWYELVLYQPDCARASRRGINELSANADGGYTYVAACDGKLSLFVNDTFGFYLNNQGYANIAVTRIN